MKVEKKKTESVQLVSPWIEYYRKVQAMFHEDYDVHVMFDQKAAKLKIYVDDVDKAAAIEALLPSEKLFGNVTLTISVIPPNNRPTELSTEIGYIYQEAFIDNPAVEEIRILRDPSLSNPMTFVVFKATVVQYYSDNISNLTGLTSCLYEDLARDLFVKQDGVFFSTAKKLDEYEDINVFPDI